MGEGRPRRLAYADPPYPGMSHLYREKTEVDHAELIDRLERDYDGWALSTDERSLASVLPLCPPAIRVLAWCRSNAPFFSPNPATSWEPVLLKAARQKPVTVRSYFVSGTLTGRNQRGGLTGQKPPGFCEWVIRCLGADPADTLDDLYPGTGAMTETWLRFQVQPPLFELPTRAPSAAKRENMLRRSAQPLEGFEPGRNQTERAIKVDRHKGARDKHEPAPSVFLNDWGHAE